jgi:hypothetical protein
MEQQDYTTLTKESLAEAIILVYKGYEYMIKDMTEKESLEFDKEIMKIINNPDIWS